MLAHPFESCFGRLPKLGNDSNYRLQLAQRFAYVLPEPHLLAIVGRQSPLVEVGAGTGYWSYLLRQRGADVIAYDQAPLGGDRDNRYHFHLWPWTEVLEGDIAAVRHHPDRSLFVCWPPLYSAISGVLQFFAGKRVIYVGDNGHRTARLAGLEEAFEEIERQEVIPMDPEPGVAAYLSVWRRRLT